MAKIPRQVSRKALPSGRTGGVPIPSSIIDTSAGIEASGLTALGRGVGQLGSILDELKTREDRNEDIIAAAEIGRLQNSAENVYRQMVFDNKDKPEVWATNAESIATGTDTRIKEIKFNDKTAGAKADLVNATWREGFLVNAQLKATAAKGQKAVQLTGFNFIRDFSLQNDNLAISEPALDAALINQYGEELAVIHKAKYLEQAAEARIGVLINNNQYAEARELVPQLKIEASEKNALNTLINTEEKRKESKVKDLNYKADMEVNTDFISKITKKELAPDEIQGSRLDDTPRKSIDPVLSKADWMRYANDSYDPPPKASKPDGFNEALRVVTEHSRRKISTESAYRLLLDERYGFRNITDEDFAWAVDKINNPLPRPILTSLEITTKNNIATAKGGFLNPFFLSAGEKEDAMQVNMDLRDWVESELTAGREPSAEDMSVKSAQLMAQKPKGELPAQITTQKERDALESGALYMDMQNGKVYRKK